MEWAQLGATVLRLVMGALFLVAMYVTGTVAGELAPPRPISRLKIAYQTVVGVMLLGVLSSSFVPVTYPVLVFLSGAAYLLGFAHGRRSRAAADRADRNRPAGG